MSAVWVRLDEARRGSLPARCARSGQRSITRYRHEVSDLPAALEWAMWTRLWPRGIGDPVETVIVPLLPARQRIATTLRRLRDVTAALLPLALVTMLMSEGTVDSVARAVGLTAVLLHLVVAVLGVAITVRLRRDTTGEWVLLSGVHPEFVALTDAVTTRPDAPPQLEEIPLPRITGAAEPLEQ